MGTDTDQTFLEDKKLALEKQIGRELEFDAPGEAHNENLLTASM